MPQTSLGSGIGGPSIGLVDKRKVSSGAGSNASPISSTLYAATRDIAALDAQLITFNAAYYTQARLDTMTRNDKIYALRLAYDAAGI